MALTREGPYREPAARRESSSEPERAPLLRWVLSGVVLLLLAAPVLALAAQPFSFYGTLVTGAVAAWSAVAWCCAVSSTI